MPSDAEIVNAISRMVDEEHQLRKSHAGTDVTAEDRDRLRSIEIELDRCWDLLRERRARRDAGQDPALAELRSAEVVERFKQ